MTVRERLQLRRALEGLSVFQAPATLREGFAALPRLRLAVSEELAHRHRAVRERGAWGRSLEEDEDSSEDLSCSLFWAEPLL